MRAHLTRISLRIAGWAATAIGTAGLLLYYGTWTWRPLVLLTAISPYLMIAGLAGAALLLAGRQWIGVVTACAVLGACVWSQVPPRAAAAESDDGHEITVMQSNLLFGRADTSALRRAVEAHGVDILTVDELTQEAFDDLTVLGIDSLLPYHHAVPGPDASGTGIFSRFPLQSPVVHDGFEMRQLSATTEIPDLGPTMVYAFHPVWPVGDSEVWAREMSMIGDILENADPTVPAIVGGDFNATNSHAQVRALVSGRFDDTNAMAGGVLRTYPNGRLSAFLGVDRIPVANGHAESISTVALPGSDHRAVVPHPRFS